MRILYKNKRLESFLIAVNAMVTIAVVAAVLLELGFDRPLLGISLMNGILGSVIAVFVIEKVFRFFNSYSRLDYFKARWFELIFFLVFVILLLFASFVIAAAVYLILEIVSKICKTVVTVAASGKSPAIALVGSFAVLILCGTVLLMLPKAHNSEPVGFVDALFTSTSATCVTGLVVKDTGADF